MLNVSHDADVGVCRGPVPGQGANSPKPQEARQVAQTLLTRVMMRVLTIALPALGAAAGCVIPPPLDLEQSDSGINASPVILSSGPAPEFSFPGRLIVEHNDTRRLTLTLSDADVNDTLHVRIYRDYGIPEQTNFVGSCTFPPSGNATRVGECGTQSFCTGLEPTDQSDKFLEAMVADRTFLDESDPAGEGQPAYRRLPAGAAFSFRSWVMRCNQPMEGAVQ